MSKNILIEGCQHNNNLINEIKYLEQQERFLISHIQEEKDRYNKLKYNNDEYQKEVEEYKNNLSTFYDNLQSEFKQGFLKYTDTLDNAYSQKEKEFQSGQEQLKKSINQLKDELNAVSAAKMREEKTKDSIKFYRIQLTSTQYKDIEKLEGWKNELYDPSIISKVIWSSYIMKPTSDLCNRLTQGKTITGIYKITSLVSSKVYIGQSVNISERIKQHVKCGLGIDASSTNKLYNLMQEEGVFNFTFEILEQCDKTKLNERERFWIETYQSNKFGLNIQGGNK